MRRAGKGGGGSKGDPAHTIGKYKLARLGPLHRGNGRWAKTKHGKLYVFRKQSDKLAKPLRNPGSGRGHQKGGEVILLEMEEGRGVPVWPAAEAKGGSTKEWGRRSLKKREKPGGKRVTRV